IVVGMCFWWGVSVMKAQDKASGSDSDKGPVAYRLEFSLYELEDGKKINNRQYSMNIVEGIQFQDIKIGTRFPVEMKQGEVQYLDVGTSISARVQEAKSGINLEVRADLSNFAIPDQAAKSSLPLLRQLRISGATIVTSAKPIVLGVVDDPNSKRQF